MSRANAAQHRIAILEAEVYAWAPRLTSAGEAGAGAGDAAQHRAE